MQTMNPYDAPYDEYGKIIKTHLKSTNISNLQKKGLLTIGTKEILKNFIKSIPFYFHLSY